MSTVQGETKRLKPGQRLTVKEFLRRWEAMPELKFAELIDGVVYMPSPLTRKHGITDNHANTWLGTYAAFTPGCESGTQATWLMLASAPQPDSYLWVLPEFGGQSSTRGKYHSGAPELAMEICLSSEVYDVGVKKSLYQRAGVQEYVAVLLQEQEIRWHRWRKGAYQVRPIPVKGVIRSDVFPGLWLDVPAFLKGDRARVLATLQLGLQSIEHAEFVSALAQRKS